jgi:hypothetical protein
VGTKRVLALPLPSSGAKVVLSRESLPGLMLLPAMVLNFWESCFNLSVKVLEDVEISGLEDFWWFRGELKLRIEW